MVATQTVPATNWEVDNYLPESTCPICRCESVPCFEKHGHCIRQCVQCHHRFFRPENVSNYVDEQYGDDYFFGADRGYQNYLDEEALQRISARHYTQVLAKYCEPGKHLDIGAACGFLNREFSDAGWLSRGIEANSTMAKIAYDKYDADVSVERWETFDSSVRFDLLTMIQIISHLLDPVAAIEKALNAVSPGGFLLIECWDRNSMAAKMFGQKWHEYNPPNVLHWFDRAGLRKLCESIGFQHVTYGRPKKRVRMDRGLAVLNYAMERSVASRIISAPLRLIPKDTVLPYFFDDAFWMLFRSPCDR
ncbi:MAG: class I SAM-dependent methyltransferase [Pirellulaceae bacterium]